MPKIFQVNLSGSKTTSLLADLEISVFGIHTKSTCDTPRINGRNVSVVEYNLVKLLSQTSISLNSQRELGWRHKVSRGRKELVGHMW